MSSQKTESDRHAVKASHAILGTEASWNSARKTDDQNPTTSSVERSFDRLTSPEQEKIMRMTFDERSQGRFLKLFDQNKSQLKKKISKQVRQPVKIDRSVNFVSIKEEEPGE